MKFRLEFFKILLHSEIFVLNYDKLEPNLFLKSLIIHKKVVFV
jgi:hypothetical protein